jgi:thiol-disulfide isomerase/thioredoxin
VRWPVYVQVLFTPTCATCAATAQLLDRLQADTPGLRVERLPLADHPELAEQFGLLSFEYALMSPHAVVIDGELASVGHPSEALLRSWLARPHPAHVLTADVPEPC